MSKETLLVPAFLGLLAAVAHAQILEFSVDRLDGDEPGGPAPAHLFVIDAFVDTAETDEWTAAVVRITTAGGASLRYAFSDPNNPGVPTLVNPGTDDRFVTFFSHTAGRDGSGRFTFAHAAIVGSYVPQGQDPIATDDELSVNWIHSPPHPHPDPAGYFARIALDLSQTGFQADDLVITTQRPDSWVLACETGQAGLPGLAALTFDFPQIVGFDWWVTVPEPATIALLLGGAALALRRRE